MQTVEAGLWGGFASQPLTISVHELADAPVTVSVANQTAVLSPGQPIAAATFDTFPADTGDIQVSISSDGADASFAHISLQRGYWLIRRPKRGKAKNWNLLVDTTDELSHQRWGFFLDLTAFLSTDLRGRWRLGSPMRTAPQLEFMNPQQIQLVPSAGSFNLSTIATSPDSVTMGAATTNATTVGRSVLMRSAGQGTAALSLDAEF